MAVLYAHITLVRMCYRDTVVIGQSEILSYSPFWTANLVATCV